ncbi:MAG TPA: hypothetical protein VKN36_11320 [Eudoraea sp.]|nr:hypothetical protein [Eudoraea sp.]
MKIIRRTCLLLALISLTALTAQEDLSAEAEGAVMGNTIDKETTKRTYKVNNGMEVIENSVKVTTEINQPMYFEDEDKGKINQDRVKGPKKVIKTVLIDNDEDDSYEERIVFSYTAEDKTDFTLVTTNDEILVAVEDGENLKILESESITISGLKDPKESYIFTNNTGENVEFFIESYSVLNEK